jgi:uncharacterized protein (TIGR03032 family)
MIDGQPHYVTACSRSDIIDGWRYRRNNGGCVIDISNDEIICTGLSMPHSPRWYQNKLWLLNSGKGDFGYVDLQTGKFEPVVFCPGFLRGLAFWGNYAIVGVSKPRGDKSFVGLPLDEELRKRDAEPRCGLMIVDLKTGAIAHWYCIEGIVVELYDVQVLPGARRPMFLGFKTDEIQKIITLDSRSPLLLEKVLSEKEHLAATSIPENQNRQEIISVNPTGNQNLFPLQQNPSLLDPIHSTSTTTQPS